MGSGDRKSLIKKIATQHLAMEDLTELRGIMYNPSMLPHIKDLYRIVRSGGTVAQEYIRDHMTASFEKLSDSQIIEAGENLIVQFILAQAGDPGIQKIRRWHKIWGKDWGTIEISHGMYFVSHKNGWLLTFMPRYPGGLLFLDNKSKTKTAQLSIRLMGGEVRLHRKEVDEGI